MNKLLRGAYWAGRQLATGGRGVAVEVNGRRFRMMPECAAAADPRYEWDKFETVMSAIRPGMAVLDIGAHHGLYSLAMASQVGSAGRVACFEPEPQNARLLRRNIALNRLSDSVSVEQMAVCDRVGTAEFGVNPADLTSGSLGSTAGSGLAYTVHTTTVDAYCAERSLRPDVIKVDVEGAEYAVLQGALQTVAARPDLVWHIELHHGEHIQPGPVALLEFAAGLGYAILDHCGNPLGRALWDSAGHAMLRRA